MPTIVIALLLMLVGAISTGVSLGTFIMLLLAPIGLAVLWVIAMALYLVLEAITA